MLGIKKQKQINNQKNKHKSRQPLCNHQLSLHVLSEKDTHICSFLCQQKSVSQVIDVHIADHKDIKRSIHSLKKNRCHYKIISDTLLFYCLIYCIKQPSMNKCMDVQNHTKTVIPCSLHSIAAAQSRRLIIIHDTENFSVLSPAKQENTAIVPFYVTKRNGKAIKSPLSPLFYSPWNALQYERKESWKNRAHKRSARPTMPATYSKHTGQHHTLKKQTNKKTNTSSLRNVIVWEHSVVHYIKQTAYLSRDKCCAKGQ